MKGCLKKFLILLAVVAVIVVGLFFAAKSFFDKNIKFSGNIEEIVEYTADSFDVAAIKEKYEILQGIKAFGVKILVIKNPEFQDQMIFAIDPTEIKEIKEEDLTKEKLEEYIAEANESFKGKSDKFKSVELVEYKTINANKDEVIVVKLDVVAQSHQDDIPENLIVTIAFPKSNKEGCVMIVSMVPKDKHNKELMEEFLQHLY